MRTMRMTALVSACLALAAQPLMAGAPPRPAVQADADIAGRWSRFLATSELDQVMDAYTALSAVGYDGDGTDPAKCREHASGLSAAIDRVPVSVALRRAAYLCAQSSGDTATAERALAELVALSRYALADAGEFETSRPIRVIAPVDADALVQSSGLERLYTYYPTRWPQRYFPMVIAARDPDTGIERHLPFDYIDAQFQIAHKDEFSGYPYERIVLTRNYIEDDDGVPDALDRKAINEAMDGPADKRIATLRAAAARGGIASAQAWLTQCGASREPHCADGLVDALLPLAEKQYAAPMVLLALAHFEGIGIGKDQKAAWVLLDAANRHWYQGGAYERFARIWHDLHGGDAQIPPALETRLAQAASEGNRYLQRIRILDRIDAKAALSADEIAFLSDRRENAKGFGYGMLAQYEEQREHWPERRRWLAQAADAGDAYAQARLGFDHWEGEHGAPRDPQAARRLLQEGAQGGDEAAGRYLGWDAMWDGRWHEAEGWLLAPALLGDELAALNLADLFAKEPPGVTGKLADSISIYRELDERGVASGRRRLAGLALQGRGVPKDPAQAKRWLLQDAEKGDSDSMVQLAAAYAEGSFGAADLTEAQRWMERAMATGDDQARDQYGSLLYYRIATPESRARALALWRQSADKGDNEGRNNLAWALCVSAYPQERDAARGLALAQALGPPDSLPAGYLDTLAACDAAAGDFDRAISLQQQAVSKVERLAGGLAAMDKSRSFRERLDLYRARKPYVESPPADHSGASSPNHSVSLTSPATQ